jgi:hypothetical protein
MLADIMSRALTEDYEELKSYLQDNMLFVKYQSEEYMWIHTDLHFYEKFIENKVDEIEGELMSELNEDEKEHLSETPINDFDRYLQYLFRKPGGVFIQSPEGIKNTMIVQYQSLDTGLKPPNKEDSAIKKVDMREYLNKHRIVPDSNAKIEDFDFDQIVFERDGKKYSLPYDFMGDGYKTMVAFLWQFLGESDSNDIILLEEPENHMHPGFVSQTVDFLIDLAREQDLQIFVTTHNLDFISQFFGEIPSHQREFLLNDFQVIQMTESVPKVFDYETAREQVEDLQVDLRGI